MRLSLSCHPQLSVIARGRGRDSLVRYGLFGRITHLLDGHRQRDVFRCVRAEGVGVS